MHALAWRCRKVFAQGEGFGVGVGFENAQFVLDGDRLDGRQSATSAFGVGGGSSSSTSEDAADEDDDMFG